MKITFDTVEDAKERAIEAINAFWPSSTNEKIDKKVKEEKKKTKKKEKKKTKKSKISKSDVRKAMQAHSEENGRDETREVLSKYSKKLEDLDPDDYADLIADLTLNDSDEDNEDEDDF